MLTLSACVITKNEAENISRCLQSIKSIVKEMIIIDTGSTDNTIAITKKFSAKVFEYEWKNDFSAARNYALEQATGDWILFLDADEYISDDKVNNVLPYLTKINGNRKFSAVACLMEHTEGVGGVLKCRDKTVRIFRNSPAIRYRGRIHESIFRHGKPANAIYAPQELISIIHTGYNNANFIAKVKRNLAFLEEDLAQNTITYLTYHYLSHSYSLLGEHEKAVEFAYKALEDGTVTRSMFAHKPYIILIQNLQLIEGDNSQTINQLIKDALQNYSHHPEILECQGNYLYARGYYTESLKVLINSLKSNNTYRDIHLANDFFVHIAQVQETIASIYDKQGDMVNALNHYVLSLKASKYNANAFSELLSLIRTQEPANMVYLLNSIYNTKNEEDICFLVTRLSALKILKVLAYYEKIWSEYFRRNVCTGMLPFLHQDFKQAFYIFLKAWQDTGDYHSELMMVITTLLGNSPEWLTAFEAKLKPSFRNITAHFFQRSEIIVSADDLSTYLDIVANFAHLSTAEQMNQLLAVCTQFTEDEAVNKIANVLINQRLYTPALTLYNDRIHQINNETEKKILYFQAGVCCYKLKKWQEASSFFQKAISAGYESPDIHEYINWTNKQLSVQAEVYNLKFPAGNKTTQAKEITTSEKFSENEVIRNNPPIQKRVLIGSPIKQKSPILRDFLSSLQALKTENLDVTYLFIDDNDNADSSDLLQQFAATVKKVIIHRHEGSSAYLCNETTHHWNERLIWKVAEIKNLIINTAIQTNMDYLFLIDSDLLLHPGSLQHLVKLEKDIVSQVFWTSWQPNTISQPQVWLYDQYSQYRLNRGEKITQQDIQNRTQQFFDQLRIPGTYEVGGLGACTLISRKALAAGVNFKEIKNVTFWGEDRHFCIRAAALGFPLYADTHYPVYHIYREKDLDGVSTFKKKCGYQTNIHKILHISENATNNKITLSMVIKNEAERYLRRVLSEVLPIIDAAVIIDDHSTDNSIELCEQILQDIPVKIIRNTTSLFSNEIELRKLQWTETLKTKPDWILNLDADEIFEKKFKEYIKQLIATPNVFAYCFRLYDFWSEKQFRDDKYWCAHHSYRPFLVKYNSSFHYEWKEQPQHCGRFPNNILNLPWAASDLRLKHMGWAKKTDRLAKYNRYKLLDPNAIYGIKEQYESILDKKPNLIQWSE